MRYKTPLDREHINSDVAITILSRIRNHHAAYTKEDFVEKLPIYEHRSWEGVTERWELLQQSDLIERIANGPDNFPDISSHVSPIERWIYPRAVNPKTTIDVVEHLGRYLDHYLYPNDPKKLDRRTSQTITYRAIWIIWLLIMWSISLFINTFFKDYIWLVFLPIPILSLMYYKRDRSFKWNLFYSNYVFTEHINYTLLYQFLLKHFRVKPVDPDWL